MNQEDAAKKLGVTEPCVWLWENLQAKPQIHYMPLIISFLGYCPFTFDLTAISGRIKNYRTLRGLNSEAFGKLVGVSDSTIGEWENGKKPKAGRMIILQKIIGK